MQIMVAGHLCLDIIPTWSVGGLEALQPGKIVVTDGVSFSTGGAVSNTGIALQRLGFEPILVGRIGDDHFGEIVKSIYRREGAVGQHLAVCPGETTSYSIVLSPPESDRAFLHYPGTNDSFSPEDVDFSLVQGGLFHFGYPPLMAKMYANSGEALQTVFRRAKEYNMVTSLDMAMPDPHSPAGKAPWRKIMATVLPYVDLFVPSIDELLFMLGVEHPGPITERVLEEAADTVIGLGASVVGIKLGESGFYLQTNFRAGEILGANWAERQLISPCFNVEVQGTTGAGDTTIAGLLAAVASHSEPEEALTLAVAVGAHCVEGVSATSAIPTLSKVKERIAAGWVRRSTGLDLNGWRQQDDGILVGPRDRKG